MRKAISVALIIIALAFSVYLGYINGSRKSLPKGPLISVTFLQERLGNAIVIKTPEGRVMVVDPGSARTVPELIKYLKNCKIKTLGILVTNPDNDHSAAIESLTDNFNVTKVMCGENANNYQIWKRIKSILESKNISVETLYGGDNFKLSPSTDFEVLSPPKGLLKDIDYSLENNSLIIRMSFSGKRFLLTSDIKTQAEASLIQSQNDISSNVLVVPHNGQYGSMSLELLSEVRPGYIVVLSRRHNRPSSSVLRRLDSRKTGAQLYRTDEDGNIEMITDGKIIAVNTHK